MELLKQVDIIRQTGFGIHVFFKNGFLERVYENSLANRLRRQGFDILQQYPISVQDEDGTVVGEYIADIVVCREIIIEIKAVKCLTEIHTAQVLAYLKATGLRHGILMNFGNPEFQIRKYIL